MITGRQIRAARGLLGWKAEDLAKRADVARETISKIEADAVQPHEKTMARIARVFDENGVEFTANSGVRLKPRNIEVYEGIDGFSEFYEFVYESLRRHGGEVCIGGSDASLYSKYRKNPEIHRERMAELVRQRDDISVRILCKEGDYNFVAASYAKYRWQPEEYFYPISFYTFGDCLALISFMQEPAPYVVLHKSGPFAEAYRRSFNAAWETAKEPPKKNRSE